MTKNWSPKDLLDTKHLLAEHRAIKEARIAKKAADGYSLPYKPGWTFAEFRDRVVPKLNPYRLALDEFETPDDRWSPGPSAKDYSDASEGSGRVTVRGSNYDTEEVESFTPRDATVNYRDAHGDTDRQSAEAYHENTLGFDVKSDLVRKMADAVKAWAGMTTPPPKAADPTVAVLVESYLANGGEVHTFRAYRTTAMTKIRFTRSLHPEWAGGTGIPPELRLKNKRFRAMPKTGSKQWSLAA